MVHPRLDLWLRSQLINRRERSTLGSLRLRYAPGAKVVVVRHRPRLFDLGQRLSIERAHGPCQRRSHAADRGCTRRCTGGGSRDGACDL